MKTAALALTAALILLALPNQKAWAFKVVIDPGHGGSDQGTVWGVYPHSVSEKEITLKIARIAAEQLKAAGVDVTLTRTRDQLVPLADRTALANKLKAQIFVSIHLNSTQAAKSQGQLAVDSARGVETYILNNTTDASSKRLAQLENSVLGGSKEDAQGQLDVALILKDLRLDANLSESKRLACLLQSHLISAREVRENKAANGFRDARADRGVRQALFHVLLGADMPSALVEAGFLTHPKDRALLLSPSGQRTIGRAVALSILEFKRKKGSVELARCKVH